MQAPDLDAVIEAAFLAALQHLPLRNIDADGASTPSVTAANKIVGNSAPYRRISSAYGGRG